MSPWWNKSDPSIETLANGGEAQPDPKSGSRRRFALQRLSSPRQMSESTTPSDSESGAGGLHDWQEAVLRYSESVPPLAAAARYYKNATLMVKFGIEDEAGNVTDQFDSVLELMHANIETIARGVELLFLIGDTRGLFTLDPQDVEMLSPGELYRKGTDLVRKNEKGRPEPVDADTTATWRTYEPSVRNSRHATSSNRALLDVFEAYRIAYGEERALSIRSAMNAGITLISDDVFGAANTGEFDSNGTEGMDPSDALEARFQAMLGRTINNPRNSAAFAPPVLTVPGDVNGKVLHVSMAEKRDTRMLERRLKALREEIAIGIDLPADIAAGFFADLNHWNVWAVDEAADKNYLRPKIGMVAKDAFHEMATAMGLDPTGWTLVVDTSALVSQRDQSDVAIDAFNSGLISDKAARESLGYTEADAPGAENADASAPDGPTAAGDTTAPDETATPAATDGDGTASRKVGATLLAVAGIERKGEASFAVSADDSADALGTINDSMKAARLKLDRDLQRLSSNLLGQLQSEAAKDGDTASASGGDQVRRLAVSDPVQKIVDSISARVLKAYKEMSLGAARGLATRQAKDWYERTISAHTKQADKAAAHALKIAQGIVTASAADSAFVGVARQMSVSIESVASGKPAILSSDGKTNGNRPGIISEDEEWNQLLNDEIEGGVEVQYVWQHGGSADPFPPHEDLDGETWFIEDEREVLDNPNDFPDSAVYHPGDHTGCTCEYDADMVAKGVTA